MYKNIIFDIGNVILNFQPEEYLKTKFIDSDKVTEIHRELFQSEEWAMLDRGTITEEEAKNLIINRSTTNGPLLGQAFENWYEILTPIEGTVEILKELKKANYKLYFLSNFHLLAFEYVTNKYDFFKLFDGGIVSYKEKLLKPEEEIYKRILEEYSLKPEESIFIDDSIANIEGAKKVNINTIHFTACKDLKENFKNYHIYL